MVGSHSRAALLLGLSLAGPAAYAQEFNFVGTVDSGTGLYADATGTVTGTYTFDFAAAVPSESTPSSSIGSAYMVETAQGGYYYSGYDPPEPEPAGVVFTSTANFSGFSFNSGGPQPNKTQDYFQGQSGLFTAVEQTVDANGNTLYSYFQITPPNGEYAYSTTTGLPILNGSTTAILASTPYEGSSSELIYTITSLTEVPAVPEPSVYLLLPAGLVALALWRRRDIGLNLRAVRRAA
jgi:hypothetical protein